MITIENKQVIITANWKVESIQMLNMATPERHSIVNYVLRNDAEEMIDKVSLEYRNEKYNDWYLNFNDMKYLEHELAVFLGVDVLLVNTLDEEYLNNIVIEDEPEQ